MHRQSLFHLQEIELHTITLPCPADANDPMTKAIHALLDHAAAQDVKLQEVMAQLNKLGADVESDAEVGKAFDVDAFKKL